MIPSILIGIEAQTVDYDAVAYRTGVILCEDPGSPSYPDEAWEVKEYYKKDEVDRFGLAVSRDSPGILLPEKIERFFNGTFFDEQDIQDRMLFSNLPFGPYAYYVRLHLDDGTPDKFLASGSPIPQDPYGYIRRAVKVKGEHYMTINLADPARQYELTEEAQVNDTIGYLPILFNLTELQNDEIPKIYQINPYQDQVVINITDFSTTINPINPLSSVRLVGVTLYKGYGNSLTKVAGTFSSYEDDRYLFYIGNDQKSLSGDIYPTTAAAYDDIGLVLKPAMFAYLEPLPGDTIQVNFSFQYVFDSLPPCYDVLKGNNTPNLWTYGVYYDYNVSNVTQMPFTSGELEVVIW